LFHVAMDGHQRCPFRPASPARHGTTRASAPRRRLTWQSVEPVTPNTRRIGTTCIAAGSALADTDVVLVVNHARKLRDAVGAKTTILNGSRVARRCGGIGRRRRRTPG
jgi:hypothetical protein